MVNCLVDVWSSFLIHSSLLFITISYNSYSVSVLSYVFSSFYYSSFYVTYQRKLIQKTNQCMDSMWRWSWVICFMMILLIITDFLVQASKLDWDPILVAVHLKLISLACGGRHGRMSKDLVLKGRVVIRWIAQVIQGLRECKDHNYFSRICLHILLSL